MSISFRTDNKQSEPLKVVSWVTKPSIIVQIEKANNESIDELIKKLFSFDGDILLKELCYFENIPNVVYVIARLYAGQYTNGIIQPSLSIDFSNRELQAVYYAKKSIELKYDEAERFLVTAFMAGFGCIRPNQIELDTLYHFFQKNNNIPALFDFACYKLNRFPSPPYEALSNDIPIRPAVKINALQDFSQILQGDNIEFILKTIDVLYIQLGPDNTIEFLETTFKKHPSQWLGLFLACLHSPSEFFDHFSKRLFTDEFKSKVNSNLKFLLLKEKIPANAKIALDYLIISEKGFLNQDNRLVKQLEHVLKQFEDIAQANNYKSDPALP